MNVFPFKSPRHYYMAKALDRR